MKKVVLITGASRGIGRDIAKKLAQNGEKVIANYNKSELKAEELKKELEKENIFIDIYKADVSKREEVKKLVKYVIDKYKRIDILINNAGISDIKLFTDVTDDDWNKVINTNLYSAFCCTQEAKNNEIKKNEAIEIKNKLEKIKLEFKIKSKEGKVFNSISTKAICEELDKKGLHIDKRKILDSEPIKTLGHTNVKIELYKDVIGIIQVVLKEED